MWFLFSKFTKKMAFSSFWATTYFAPLRPFGFSDWLSECEKVTEKDFQSKILMRFRGYDKEIN